MGARVYTGSPRAPTGYPGLIHLTKWLILPVNIKRGKSYTTRNNVRIRRCSRATGSHSLLKRAVPHARDLPATRAQRGVIRRRTTDIGAASRERCFVEYRSLPWCSQKLDRHSSDSWWTSNCVYTIIHMVGLSRRYEFRRHLDLKSRKRERAQEFPALTLDGQLTLTFLGDGGLLSIGRLLGARRSSTAIRPMVCAGWSHF